MISHYRNNGCDLSCILLVCILLCHCVARDRGVNYVRCVYVCVLDARWIFISRGRGNPLTDWSDNHRNIRQIPDGDPLRLMSTAVVTHTHTHALSRRTCSSGQYLRRTVEGNRTSPADDFVGLCTVPSCLHKAGGKEKSHARLLFWNYISTARVREKRGLLLWHPRCRGDWPRCVQSWWLLYWHGFTFRPSLLSFFLSFFLSFSLFLFFSFSLFLFPLSLLFVAFVWSLKV